MDDWTFIGRALLAAWVGMGAVSIVVFWRIHFMARSFISLGMALGATFIFAASAWAAYLTDRRLQGLEPLPWSTFVTVPLLMGALSVPIAGAAMLLWHRYR